MSETLPYAEKALKIETSGMNITHVGSVVEGMMLDMEYEEVKFNLHQDRNVYFLSSSDEKVDFDEGLGAALTRPSMTKGRLSLLDGS